MIKKASIARQLWQFLPSNFRCSLRDLIARKLAPHAGSAMPSLRPGAAVTVAGLLRSPSGLGEGARLCEEALRALGFPVDQADLSGALTVMLLDDMALPPAAAVDRRGGVTVIHLNAPTMPMARLLLGRQRTAGQRVIGYWAWELPEIPASWQVGFRYVHEIWTPSQFCADAILPFSSRPVRVVPHPVTPLQPSERSRADFGLADGVFTVLSLLHLDSGYARKNPIAAVRAFRQAFGNRTDVRLLVKVTADAVLPWAEWELTEAIGGAANIQVMNTVLSRADQAALLHQVDAIMSLHRSEGFGLPLAEAMLSGKPVIATGWSGNMEFMTPDCAALVGYRLVPVVDPQGIYDTRQVWAEPDIGEAAVWLRRLCDETGLAKALGAAGAHHATARLGLPAYAAAVSAALPSLL